MEPDKVNRWLTLGANIGVLIGIILLVVELDQNREMINAQTRNDISQQLSSRLLLVANNKQLTSVLRRAEAGEDLTVDEGRQYFLYLVANMRDWENIHYQYRHGMFDENEFEAEKSTWQYLINKNHTFLDIWCPTRRNYSPEFTAEINNILADDVCTAAQGE